MRAGRGECALSSLADGPAKAPKDLGSSHVSFPLDPRSFFFFFFLFFSFFSLLFLFGFEPDLGTEGHV